MLKFLMDTPAKVSKNIGAYFFVSEHYASFHFFLKKTPPSPGMIRITSFFLRLSLQFQPRVRSMYSEIETWLIQGLNRLLYIDKLILVAQLL